MPRLIDFLTIFKNPQLLTTFEPNISKLTGTYNGAEGRSSPFDLHLSGKGKGAPLVIFAHGYKGFKDWGCWDLVAEKFARSGFDFLKFNFTHNGGTVEEPIDFPDLDAFSRNTYSMEVGDFHTIISAAFEGLECNGQTRQWDRIALIGHSRGGGIAVIAAAENLKVSALACWAAVADFGERFSFDIDKWKAEGTAYVKNGRTGQDMPHRYRFYEDYIEHRERLNILASASRVSCPAIAVHGTVDEAVDPGDAGRLASAFSNGREVLISGAGHTFGGKHPWTEAHLPDHLDQAVEASLESFNFLL